ALLLFDVHGFEQGLVAIAQVDAGPARSFDDAAVGPLALGHGGRDGRPVSGGVEGFHVRAFLLCGYGTMLMQGGRQVLAKFGMPSGKYEILLLYNLKWWQNMPKHNNSGIFLGTG